jgi:hypothetical protein
MTQAATLTTARSNYQYHRDALKVQHAGKAEPKFNRKERAEAIAYHKLQKAYWMKEIERIERG